MSGIISQKEMISSLEINFVPVVDVLGNVRKSTKSLKVKTRKMENRTIKIKEISVI